jgi:hypothetical protein
MSVTTFVTYNGDGVTTDFAIPFAYTTASEVVVTRRNGAVTYTFFTGSIIRLTSPAALAVGDVLTIERVTNIDAPKVVFKNGSGQTGGQLNSMVTQLLRGMQEVTSRVARALYVTAAGVYDFGGYKASNVANPVSAQDAVTKSYGDTNYGGSAAASALSYATAASGSASAAATSATNANNSAIAAAASAVTAATFNPALFPTKANNLSDLASAATARTNLAVYSSAATDTLLNAKANTAHTHTPADLTSAPMAAIFRNLFIGNGGTPNTQVNVVVDQVVATNGTTFAVGTSLNLTISTASSGAANALDTGSVAANTWYSVWAIYNGTTWAGLLSTSTTAPTMPSGYTYKVRLGWVRTDGSSILYRTRQVNRTAVWLVTAATNVPNLPLFASGAIGNVATPTWVSTSLAGVCPPTTVAVDVKVSNATSGGGGTAYNLLAPNNAYGGANSLTNPPTIQCMAFDNGSAGQAQAMHGRITLEAVQTIYIAQSGTSARVWAVGWEDGL